MLGKNKTGISLGILFALVHAVWALAVAVIPDTLQKFLDWVFNLHSITPVWVLTSFNWLNALLLVIITFVFGYILGWIFAWAHNLRHKTE